MKVDKAQRQKESSEKLSSEYRVKIVTSDSGFGKQNKDKREQGKENRQETEEKRLAHVL